MPYSSIDQLPDPVRHSLPVHAQEIFKEAFNAAYFAKQDQSDEVRAFKIAWSAVKKAYKKSDEGKWVRKSKPKAHKGH